MDLFDWGTDAFEVVFDGVELSPPNSVVVGEDIAVDAEVRTLAGSDDYWVEEVQLYLAADTGTYILDRQGLDNPVGGAVGRERGFRFEVPGERVKELADAGHITAGELYDLETYTIFQDIDQQDVDAYRDGATEALRFR